MKRIVSQAVLASSGWLLGAMLMLPPQAAQGQVIINELLINNNTILVSPDGVSEPIIGSYAELFNNSGTDIDLGAVGAPWGLSDTTNRVKFLFRPGTVIPAYSFLMVFIDSNTNNLGIHAGFDLRNNGDDLTVFKLVLGTTNIMDRLVFGPQVADYAIGRIPDFTGRFQINTPTPLLPNEPVAQLGSISTLKLNEWMATNNLTSEDNMDWLEVYNPASNVVVLDGLIFSSTPPPTLPANRPVSNHVFVAAGSFLRLWCYGNNPKDPDQLDFKLSHNTGETVTLYSPQTNAIDQVVFLGNNAVPGTWGSGTTYGRLPDGAPPPYFRFGTGGIGNPSPGDSNFAPMTNVVVSEVLSHTDPPLEDAIELHNPTAFPADISYWWLSNEKDTPKKFRIPAGTVIPPYGFKVFYEMVGAAPGSGFNTTGTGTGTNFSFNSARGDRVVLCSASNDTAGTLTGFRIVEEFGAARNGMALGRYLNSETNKDFVPMSFLSFGTSVTASDPPAFLSIFRTGQGTNNAYPLVGPLVISEIMYHPPDIIIGTNHIDDSTNEFIEIYNMGVTNVPLYDMNGFYYADRPYPVWPNPGIPFADGRTNTWRLRGGTDYDFPTNVVLTPGQSLLLVNFSTASTNIAMVNAFRAKYGVPANVPIFGPYKGKLSNSGGTVSLYRPDWPQGPNQPEDFTNRFVPYFLVEQVNYNDKGSWPTNADGRGYSLQRIVPEQYVNDPLNWTAAPPTPGWQDLRLAPAQKSGNALILSFRGLAGGSYTILQRDNANSGAWSKFQDFPPQTNTGTRYATNPALITPPRRFYRVVTPQQ